MASLSAGALDREVTIQTLTESVGATRLPIESWVRLDEWWMARRDQRGYERFRAGQNAGAAETAWQGQYREDMDPERIDVVKKRRLLYAGRAYDIVAASVIGRNEGIEVITIAASEVRA